MVKGEGGCSWKDGAVKRVLIYFCGERRGLVIESVMFCVCVMADGMQP